MQAKNLFLASKQTKKTILPQSGVDGISVHFKFVSLGNVRKGDFVAFASLIKAICVYDINVV